MRWSRAELDAYLARPGKPHDVYGSEKQIYSLLVPAARKLLG